MDERRDPGEFYPGGRVIGRDGVAPGQTVVNWSDIQGKPDFSDVAALGEEATRGEMKQTMNTVINKLKTSLLIGALFVVGSAVADPEPLFAKADDIPGNQQIMTNVQAYVDAKVDSIPAPDFTVSNDTLVATIEATAPAPGNYAAVSNAAMNAAQRNTFTNDVSNIVTNEVLYGWYLEEKDHWGVWYVPQSVAKFAISNLTWSGSTVSYVGNGTQYSFDVGVIDTEELCRDADVYVYVASSYGFSIPIGSDPSEWTGLLIGTRGGHDDSIQGRFSAVRYNKLGLARLVDVPTKTSQMENDSGFVTASITNDTPSRAEIDAGWWSEWVVFIDGTESNAYNVKLGSFGWELWVVELDIEISSVPSADPEEDDFLDFGSRYTATRHRVAAPVPTKPEDIGAASTDALTAVRAAADAATATNAAQSAAIAAIPATVTNIVRDLSLGGIWDSQLEVWWTPRMRNGNLTYEATTNVNLNAGN